jgi:putative DNA methylase
MQKRKLIEVALPLEAINRESVRENYIYRGNPSSVHKWWTQKPLAAARAVLFAQLVDDPSACQEEFPTEELQRKERERLHRLIERLVVWENARDEKLFAAAHAEILKSTDGNPPTIFDPFAGGGTIPLEAQRLGLQAHACDLNPVAVLISKALIEIVPKFSGQTPVFPGLAESEIRTWNGAMGLAADVRAYGSWLRDRAVARFGHLYPDVDGKKVIAWLWTRTVECPNPACGIQMPLTHSWWIGRRKGRECYVQPQVIDDASHPSGRRVKFNLRYGKAGGPTAGDDGTIGRQGARCVACSTALPLSYIRGEGQSGRLSQRLMAIAAEGQRGREYLPATPAQEAAAFVTEPTDGPAGELPEQALGFRVQGYGLKRYTDLFTARELTALIGFSDLIGDVPHKVVADGGSTERAEAIATFLAMSLSKVTDYVNSLAPWYPQEDRPKNLFALQAIPMAWNFAELNPLSDIGGGWTRSIQVVSKSFENLTADNPGLVTQGDAAKAQFDGELLSTDPPYYDNVQYSDLSDFFYVWLRRSLKAIHPELFSTMLVPKAEELVANPYRHGGRDGARKFFESGFRNVFARARDCAQIDAPITVYYAFKQSEGDESGQASTGWEALLEGMVRGGWQITATWPLRSERGGRMRDISSNALASSIVLSLRPRSAHAPRTSRREFIAQLGQELPKALRKLQQGRIAPVDLPQAAIGPGMGIFSSYQDVLESDGSTMSVRSALARINEVLDQVLNEQEGDFDPTTRFAIAWYRQHGYSVGKYGDAELLANARGAVVQSLDRDGVLVSRAGNVNLIEPDELTWDYDPVADLQMSNWEALHHLIKVMERDGIAPAGEFLRAMLSRPDGAIDADLVKELAHLLFRIAEGNGWTKDALSFNNLVTSWPEILDVARSDNQQGSGVQSALDFEEGDD